MKSQGSPVSAMRRSRPFTNPPECAEGQKREPMEQFTLITQAASPDVLLQFAPLLIIFVIFYLLIFMPMKKRQKKVESMIAAL